MMHGSASFSTVVYEDVGGVVEPGANISVSAEEISMSPNE